MLCSFYLKQKSALRSAKFPYISQCHCDSMLNKLSQCDQDVWHMLGWNHVSEGLYRHQNSHHKCHHPFSDGFAWLFSFSDVFSEQPHHVRYRHPLQGCLPSTCCGGDRTHQFSGENGAGERCKDSVPKWLKLLWPIFRKNKIKSKNKFVSRLEDFAGTSCGCGDVSVEENVSLIWRWTWSSSFCHSEWLS